MIIGTLGGAYSNAVRLLSDGERSTSYKSECRKAARFQPESWALAILAKFLKGDKFHIYFIKIKRRNKSTDYQ